MKAEILIKTRIRKIPRSFSWIDHRFVNGGFMESLTRGAVLLYFFLTTVGNRNGLSFYGEEKLCKLLKVGMTELLSARSELVKSHLIAYGAPVYQVLSLPQKPVAETGEQEPEVDGLPPHLVHKFREEVKAELKHHFGRQDFPEHVLRNLMQARVNEYLAVKKVLG